MAAAGWLILPGDLPLIHSNTLSEVAAALCASAAVVPLYKGHPVGFHAHFRSELLNLKGCRGAGAVVQFYGAIELKVDDIGCVTDVDTVDALQTVVRLMRDA